MIISDHEYPKLVAHKLLTQVMDDFLTLHPRARWAVGQPTLELPSLAEYITKYQDPRQADSILKIQQELDETKIVLHKTIESVLERGTKIENLVERSEGLSAQSKMFYTQVNTRRSTNHEKPSTDYICSIGQEAEFMLCNFIRRHLSSQKVFFFFLVFFSPFDDCTFYG